MSTNLHDVDEALAAIAGVSSGKALCRIRGARVQSKYDGPRSNRLVSRRVGSRR